MKTIVIYGPPAIGKSSLIKRLLMLGYRCIDLEWFKSDQRRKDLANRMVPGELAFIGAADTQPYDYDGEGFVHVRIRLDKAAYLDRFVTRQRCKPKKTEMHVQEASDIWMRFERSDIHDKVLENADINQTIFKLLTLN
jgi:hypothetical protein